MAVSDGHTTAREMKMRLREKPLSELTEEFEQLSGISDCDVDLLRAYLDVLEEKAPVLPEGYDPAVSYENFKEAHSELFDPPPAPPEKTPPGRRPLLRLKQVLVSFAALFCVVILVADASGAGVLNRLIEWGTETFSLRPASGVMELEKADENGFRSMQEALEYYGVKDPAIPTWIPERYAINKITALVSNNITIISGKYVANNNDELLIRSAIGYNEDFMFEENHNNKHTLYETNGFVFIQSKNFDEERAIWTIGDKTYSVGGNVTEAEIKKMLDSIQSKE